MEEKLYFFKDEGLALIKLKGSYDFQSIESLSRLLADQFWQSGSQKCIIDFRDTFFQFDYLQVQLIYNSLINLYPITKYAKWVFITNTPKTTIYVLLFIKNIEKTKISAIQCSTLEYALQILGVKSSINEIANLLEEYTIYSHSSSSAIHEKEVI